jgi:hypothetical protein
VDDFLAHLVTTSSASLADVGPRLPSLFEPMRLGPALETTSDPGGYVATARPKEKGSPWEVLLGPDVTTEPAEGFASVSDGVAGEAPAAWAVTPHSSWSVLQDRGLHPAPIPRIRRSVLAKAPSPVTNNMVLSPDDAIPLQRPQAGPEPSLQEQSLQPIALHPLPGRQPARRERPSEPATRWHSSHPPSEQGSPPRTSEALPSDAESHVVREFVVSSAGAITGEQAGSRQRSTATPRTTSPKATQDEERDANLTCEMAIDHASFHPWADWLDARLAALAIVPRDTMIDDIGSQAAVPATPQPAPTIHVTIGRVEVRATAPATPTPRKTIAQPPVMSLEDYLRQRDGGHR